MADDPFAETSKAAVLAAISHELRTPLTTLTGYGELLSDEILGTLTPLQRDTVERMRTVTHHLTVMVDGLLTFSNLEMGREAVSAADVDPVALVRETMVVMEPLARKRHLALTIASDPASSAPVSPLHTDADKVRHILLNLVDNAIKFTEEGSVTLTVTDAGDVVCFAVADTGIGIAPADLPRLFHPFAQLDAGLTRRYGGIGLGLYVARRLAALLGGEITVAPVPGGGSVFSLVVPRP